MNGMARTFAWTAVAAFAVGAAMTFAVASSAQPADPSAGPAFRPCDWVPVVEVSEILGKQVLPTPSDNQAGSNDPGCFYAVTGDDTGLGISSELLLPGASP